MGIGRIIAWGMVAAVLGVVIFVKSPQNGGGSGGTQASEIINALATGVASVLRAAQGG